MKINILGLGYEVLLTDQVSTSEALNGMIDYQKLRILLDKNLAPDLLGQTFMHEVMHGVFNGLGMEDLRDDEKAVQSIATALYCTFKDYFTFSLEV